MSNIRRPQSYHQYYVTEYNINETVIAQSYAAQVSTMLSVAIKRATLIKSVAQDGYISWLRNKMDLLLVRLVL